MYGRKLLNRHAALVNRMAQLAGVNLTELILRGRFSGEEWREAVVRCTSCSAPDACLDWLADHAERPGTMQSEPAELTPSYCANRMMMARLRHMEGALAENADGGM